MMLNFKYNLCASFIFKNIYCIKLTALQIFMMGKSTQTSQNYLVQQAVNILFWSRIVGFDMWMTCF